MKQYSNKEKKMLCKKINQNRKDGKNDFDGFTKEDKLALALWQVKVLNRNSELDHIREAWDRWNKLVKLFIAELLQESLEVPTNKGMRKILNIEGNLATLCKKCDGTGINYQSKNNKCDCLRGWFYDNKLRLINEEEYKKRAIKRYFKKLKEKRMLSKYLEEDLLKMNLEDFLYVTGITIL